MKLLIDIFKGNFSLAKTFWLVNILGNLITGILIDIKPSSNLLILIYFVYFLYSFISTWNSSTKYIALQKKNNTSPFLGYTSKIITVLLVYFPIEWYFLIFL